MKNKRSKYWTIILYENSDNLAFKDYIDILTYISNDIVYILHDKDVDENGDIKPHYHIVLSFTNYKWLNSLSEETGIPTNYFQDVRSLDNILLYLIHYEDNSKFQYSITEVKGSLNLISKLEKTIKNYNKSEDDKVYAIFEYIINNQGISFSNLMSWVIKSGYWSEFRRGASIFIKLLDENNYKYYNYSRKEF